MSMIDTIRSFIERECPHVTGNRINLNFIPEAIEYIIEQVPANPVIKAYIDGSSLRQIVFVFASRELYGVDTEHSKSSEFYEKFADWLEDITKNRKFPDLGEGKEVLKMLATTGGYVVDTQTKSAIYQIQCRLEHINM